MKKMSMILLFLISSLATNAANTVKEKPFYGEEIKATNAIPVENVLKQFSKYENKELVMEAHIEKVCSSKGCWMTLKGTKKDLKSTFRVKFKDYKFFVPLSLIGKTVWVDGKIMRKEISVSDTRHYLEDAGASKDKIASVTEPSFEYSFMAKGVKLIK
jgi:hypothetical protein